MKRTKCFFTLLIALSTHFVLQAQQNPAALNPLLSKTPFTGIGDEFDFSFSVGNNGTIAISGVGDFNRMRFDMTLGKCKPKVPAQSSFSIIGTDAVSGAALDLFDITYDPVINTFTGVQKANVPIGILQMVNFTVHAVVTSESSAANAPEIGGSVDVTPNVSAQAANQPEIDDDVAYFTYTLTVLPVTGLSLKATLDNNNRAILSWQTVTETNSAYFQVERSDNGNSFYALGKVPASGNSNVVKNYNFSDPEAFSTAAYYRIRLYDKDGKVTVSNIETLAKNLMKDISLFPNPAKSFVTVSGLTGRQTIVLYDYKGSKMQQVDSRGNTQRLVVEGYAAGTYVVQVLEHGKVISTKKFIKQ